MVPFRYVRISLTNNWNISFVSPPLGSVCSYEVENMSPVISETGMWDTEKVAWPESHCKPLGLPSLELRLRPLLPGLLTKIHE